MTTRELFQAIMNYGEFDRMPVIHWRGWDETRRRWIAEGLPEDFDEEKFEESYLTWTGLWWTLRKITSQPGGKPCPSRV